MDNNIPGGYSGKILRVNLSSKVTTVENVDESICRSYIGGAGLIGYYLWNEMKAGADALSPDNKLIFALGPISGLQLPGAGRHCIGAKSPLTGGIAKAEAGGFWAAELKRAGYDAIIVEGKSEKPVYLWINDDTVEIKDASHLWGKETFETQESIRTELDDDRIQLSLIGPGGENLVRYACIMSGLHNVAGRGGTGAVMGSKNLKAIAVRGHKTPAVFNKEYLSEFRKQVNSNMSPFLTEILAKYGTGGPDMLDLEAIGNLPVHNFSKGLFPGLKNIHGGVIKDSFRIGMEGCFACQVRCKKVLKMEKPYVINSAYGGPEYETLAALGSNCGISNLEAICKGNERCNAYSLDTISTGSTIAFAMECFEKGLLTKRDTGGIELRFGNSEAMLELIDMIAKRQGIGQMFAEGTSRLAGKIGGGSEEFAMQVKGLDVGMHEPRLNAGLGLTFMVNPQGGDHCGSVIDLFMLTAPAMTGLSHLGIVDPLPPGDLSPRKIAYSRLVEIKKMVDDCLVVCGYLDYSADKEAELLGAVTGWKTGAMELLRVGERYLTISRLFNLQEGLSAKDDVLPGRFFQAKTEGSLSGKHLDRAQLEHARDYYYLLMGWDKRGVPLAEKIEELGINVKKR
jgi:aldehyde:ferredoxin oxidoreductase